MPYEPEYVRGESIGFWRPRQIIALRVVIDNAVPEVKGRTVEAKDPVFWPPQAWALGPEFDYHLVRVPRAEAAPSPPAGKFKKVSRRRLL